MVERRGALRIGEPRGNTGNGVLEEALVGERVAFISRARGVGHRVGCPAALHSHRSATRQSGFRGWVGRVDVASARATKKRPPKESLARSAPTQLYLGCLIPQKWGTSRLYECISEMKKGFPSGYDAVPFFVPFFPFLHLAVLTGAQGVTTCESSYFLFYW
jgi:hypothetical protein